MMPADRFRRVERVQSREDQVARLRRLQRRSDRLDVAHLADEDDVRILAQRAAQRGRERARVAADLALLDDRRACSGAETRSDPRPS